MRKKKTLSEFKNDTVNQIKNITQEKKITSETKVKSEIDQKLSILSFEELIDICSKKKEVKLNHFTKFFKLFFRNF